LQLNANAFDFCDNPSMRTGRVMAVTDKAIVVADTGNPVGGFTAEEYRSIGVDVRHARRSHGPRRIRRAE
jgi:hypothetical protein